MELTTETNYKGDRLILLPISDIHFGNPACAVSYLEGYIRWAESNPEVYILGNGDWMEAVTRTSKGDIYSQTPPQQQLEYLYHQFYKIAKKGRLLAIRNGNHENRIYNETGLDPSKILSEWLKVPYLGATSFHIFNVGKQRYVAASRHGSTGASTLEGKIRSVKNFAKTHTADIHIEGHSHHAFAIPEDILIPQDGGMGYGRRCYVNSGHFLDYATSYAAEKGYEIGRRGSVKIKLYGTKHDFHAGI